ncbi:MAG: cyclic nucleotide-binding domain-containing protein, partial [Pseudomonadota bacterium]
RQGEAGDRFYIIEEGVAEVWRRGLYDDDQSQVAELRVGDHFGDEALLVGGTRNATVRMASDGRLLVLDKADFQELIGNPLVEEVDASVAKALIEDGYEVVDVRYEEEFEDGHLANVTLIPLPELRSRLKELSPKKKFLTYCLSGKRSAVAAMIMQQHGLKTVCLKDGLREWPYELEAGMA